VLLDLFCGAGGASMGYYRAGFDVVGVDIKRQSRYPFSFLCDDALEVLTTVDLSQFAAIHASPPCQDHSTTRDFGGDHGTGWMLLAVRDRLKAIGRPWVLENVQGSPLPHQRDLFGANGLTLCGCMFDDLRGLLYEDRLFETSFPVAQPPHRRHQWAQTKMGRPPQPNECMQVTGHFSDVPEGRRRMGIPWMTQSELAQAIPPAYTEHVGRMLMEVCREPAR
jgi:DNA (cytosine-5)-methyltransferase 1